MVNSTYTPGVGGLATSRYDFQEHITGVNFRHNADQIDVNPAVIIDGVPYITVASALYALGDFVSLSLANGQGFVTVGDGYDTYHAANGSINFDPAIPSIDTLLNPLFQTIANAQAVLAGNALPFPSAPSIVPPQYARIQYGGVIVIKSGTYIVKSMILVPPGITILGEGYGTKIINASGLNTNVSPGIAPSPLATGALASPATLNITNASNSNPIQITTSPAHGLSTGNYVSIRGVLGNTNANTFLAQITVVDTFNFTLNGITGSGIFTPSISAQVVVNNPIFFILPDTNRNDNDAVIDATAGNVFMFGRETKIANLVISDNFVEPTILGDLNYKQVQNLTNSSYASFAFPLIYQQNGSSFTLDNVAAIGRVHFSSGTTVNNVTAGLVETFTFPIIPVTGANPTTGSILKVNNCFIDGFGVPFTFLGLRGNKDFVKIINSKIRAYGYLGGDSTSSSHNTFLSTSDANINIDNNHFYGNDINMLSIVDINQLSGSPSLQQKSKIIESSNNVSIANIATSNNTVNNTFQFYTFGGGAQPVTHVSLIGLPQIVTNSASPFTIDGLSNIPPYNIVTLLLDTSTGVITINLSSAAINGQTVIIKDIGGHALLNNITITPLSGQSIDSGVASASYIYATNYGSITLVSNAGNWWAV